ncbi:phospholipase D-like domain-containing protein [Niameybacter massiliensis]|uniref:Phospholipase D-like domain-containing protein n=1 Tax=Holtiella tumoricola TaxID=3018743 RepID=A0AA42DQW8_9FIRM|nr:phospholipase D-like domain-containing protein [Holtiella tumoricola]MDA3733590.1 phospholipase D-like domain-containing protein [Holtiella tumoricola]
MKKEFCVKRAKYIYTKDELGYQEVLDDFENAEKITIVTFNISQTQTYLIDYLKKAPDNAEIKIITNIPGRWESYYESFRANAQKKIKVYMTKLKPEDIGGRVQVYFNFKNHGKIIMTNNVVYIGSSNYSEESASNIEFGFIIRDEEFIEYLVDEIISDVTDKSLQYYEYNYTPLLLEANMAVSALFNLKTELYYQIYKHYEDYGGSGYYYNTDEDLLSGETLQGLWKLMVEAEDILEDIYQALDKITYGDIEILENATEIMENSQDLCSKYEDLHMSDTIESLADFSMMDYSNEILEEEYSSEAYDENLDYYVELSMDAASEKLENLCLEAKDELDKLLDTIEEFIEQMNQIIILFEEQNICKVNPKVNNTGLN